MAKLAVFIDQDIIVRHFILSGVMLALESKHDVVYVFPEQEAQEKNVHHGQPARKVKRVTADPASLPVKRYRTLSISNERLYLYRRLYQATVLRRMRSVVLSRPQYILNCYWVYRLWMVMLGKRSFLESLWKSFWWNYESYHKNMLEQIGEDAELNKLMDEEKPDAVIHPTVLEGPFVADLIRWGQAHNVPTIYLMNSWDNPSVKAMTIGCPDWLVAWGEQSRQIAHQRLGMPLDRIVCFGAAQFDVYRQPPRESHADYRKRLGIPDDHRMLLYAGSSKGLNETKHLQILEEAIEQGDLPNCTVLYRPHPWGGTNQHEQDFFAIPWRHVIMAPDLTEYYHRKRSGERAIYYQADYQETHVILSAVDAVFSPLSTILLEAALHGKPIVAYLHDEDLTKTDGDKHERNEKRRLRIAFGLVKSIHFGEFFQRVDCIRCKRPQRLVRDCQKALDLAVNPEFGQKLKRQCEFFVSSTTDHSYSRQLCDLVDTVTQATTR